MKIEDHAIRLRGLMRISTDLMEAQDPNLILERIVQSACELFAADGCSIALFDEQRQELDFKTNTGQAGITELKLKRGEGIAGWVAGAGESVLSNDVSRDDRFFAGADASSGIQTKAVLCSPLIQGETTIGALEVINTEAASGFQQRDLELLEEFAGLAVVAIARGRELGRLSNVNEALRDEAYDRHAMVVGESEAMNRVVETARMAAGSTTTVLLLGESGVGKEIFARKIHSWSPRADGPFVAVNCAALTKELLESELFGHEKGAFTGAVALKKGKFELAHDGTIFLDEIGDLDLSLQVKLLRVLQEREVQRVGGSKDIRVDVRVIAATNRNLTKAMEAGEFREDLYYRLNVVSVTIPPLRNRLDDLMALAHAFVARFARQRNRIGLRLSESAIDLLRSYHWPGNIRQLQNAIERAVVLSGGLELSPQHFPDEVRQHDRAAPADSVAASPEFYDLPLGEAINAFKTHRIRLALEKSDGNRTRAADLLGIHQPNLSRLIRSLGINWQSS